MFSLIDLVSGCSNNCILFLSGKRKDWLSSSVSCSFWQWHGKCDSSSSTFSDWYTHRSHPLSCSRLSMTENFTAAALAWIKWVWVNHTVDTLSGLTAIGTCSAPPTVHSTTTKQNSFICVKASYLFSIVLVLYYTRKPQSSFAPLEQSVTSTFYESWLKKTGK